MTEQQQSTEIARLLDARARKVSPFEVLRLDIESCTVTDVNRSFRRIALLLHPDKCFLPRAADAFNVAEKVHKTLSQGPVLLHLQRAHQKKKEQGTSATGPLPSSSSSTPTPTSTSAAAAGPSPAIPTISFGTLSKLAATGLSTDAQKAAEIRRILQCKATDYFIILDVDPDTCEVADVDRRYRRMAQALHPDKCSLPHVVDAFNVFERAHKGLADEKKLVRYKVGFQQQRKHAVAVQAEVLRRRNQHPQQDHRGVDTTGLTDEERHRTRTLEAQREQQLEAARLADEAARKKRRVEKEAEEKKELAAELERQQREWRELQLF